MIKVKVKDLVKKLLELDQDREIELSTDLIDTLDINPIINNCKFPTSKNKVIFTYKNNSLLPRSFHCYFYDARIDREYQFRLLRSMTIFCDNRIDYRRFRTSIRRWSLRFKNINFKSTRP